MDADDDLPPPAYQPQAQQPAAGRAAGAAELRRAARAAPGTPSPEALARLQAAVRKQPRRSRRGRSTAVGAADPHARRAPALRDQLADQPDDRPRGAAPRRDRRRAAAGPASAAQLTRRRAEDETSAEQERIEIPAFLRRQAN